MKVIYVDDERSAHINFYYDLKDRTDIDTVECFFTANDALNYVQKNYVDFAFLDINLGESTSGIDLADELKGIQPQIEVAFVTAYDEYARDAYRVGGRAYLSKPYTVDELDESLTLLRKLANIHRKEDESANRSKEDIYIRTFGNFDMIVNEIPIKYTNAKAKELLAFLVNQKGGTVNSSEIFMALWEKNEYTPATSTYVRRTIRALRAELEKHGISDILIVRRNCYSVDISRFTCDYYDVMDGDITAIDYYNGEYMKQYYWGESTIALIERKIKLISNEK